MQPLAERVADDIRADVERLGGRVDVGGAWAIVDGDEVLLRQAISNLARNAIEACEEAGIVPAIQIYGEVDREARLLRLHVTDNGPGIDPAHRERIFRPFFTTKQKGTGLGLALVQKIVVTHNGRVHALPGPGGRGASMSVTLPLGSV
jgi:signal transduction histidine kinase